MNIFVLDEHPEQSAEFMCDKHVPKMILESAQLLCSSFKAGTAPYKRTHYNHPCAIWTRQTKGNFCWLLEHAYALGDEYFKRYNGKTHKSQQVLDWCWNNMASVTFEKDPGDVLTPHPQCMPDKYKVTNDPVQAYRNYYKGNKSKFAKWEKGSPLPGWWINQNVF